MHGVTTAIVGFIFAGVLWPHIIKNRVQFYAALIVVVFIILLDGIAHIAPNTARPIYAVNALLQITALVTLVLSTGMSAKDLGGEVFNTIDVVRRGGEKETIIVPLTGEKPRPRGSRDVAAMSAATTDRNRDIAAEEAALDAAEGTAPAPLIVPPAARKPDAGASIPLE
jgi:hypothetical protein